MSKTSNYFTMYTHYIFTICFYIILHLITTTPQASDHLPPGNLSQPLNLSAQPDNVQNSEALRSLFDRLPPTSDNSESTNPFENFPELHFLVAFEIYSENETGDDICTGSALSPFWILTSADCLQQYAATQTIQVKLQFGETQSTHSVAEIHKYPFYAAEILYHNIGLLELNASSPPLPLTNFAKLVTTKQESDKCLDGLALGFRKANKEEEPDRFELIWEKMRMLKINETCIYNFPNQENDILDGSGVYAIEQNITIEPCLKCYGGPLVCVQTGRIIGIFSQGYGGCYLNYYNLFVYVKIESYFHWIGTTTGMQLPNWRPTDEEYKREVLDWRFYNYQYLPLMDKGECLMPSIVTCVVIATVILSQHIK